jgi:hypothetical protein
MAENTLEGTARKRGQYRGAWRARYFVLNAAQSRLDYWESREDKENHQKPRGAIKVRGASPLNDKDEPYSLVVRAANAYDEWLALDSLKERDRWVTALQKASLPSESFEPDDDVWEDATHNTDAGDIRNATVYDCSVSRHHLQLEFAYHILVQGERGEPWSVRRSHAALRSLLRTQCDLSQLDEECAKDRALDPRRFLASRLRRRVALVNSLLSRVIASPDFRAFVTEDDEDVPPEEPPAPVPQRDVAWLLPLLPDPRIAALCGAVLCGVVSRAYGVPNGLVVAIFAAGAATGLACAGVVPVQRVQKVTEDGGTCTLPRWPRVGGHCWSEPRAALFRVRGPTYLQDRIKEPSDSALCRLIGVDLFSTDTPESNLCRRRESFAQRVGEDAPPLIIALNFCLPWGNFALYWAAPEEEHDVLQQFLDSDDDAYRDARLKLIPRVVEGNWLVRRAVGPGSKAAKLAETIELKYARGAGYVEVSADLCGSATARRILSVVRSGTSGLVLDLALVVEGTNEAELPERVLGAARLHRVDPDLAEPLPVC